MSIIFEITSWWWLFFCLSWINSFYNNDYEILEQGLANYGPSACRLFLSMKVVLEHSCGHLFAYCLFLLSPLTADSTQESYSRDAWPTKLSICSLALYGSGLTP